MDHRKLNLISTPQTLKHESQIREFVTWWMNSRPTLGPSDPAREYKSAQAAWLAAWDSALEWRAQQTVTDEELDEFAVYWWGREAHEGCLDHIERGDMGGFARAVLKQWGNQPQ